MSRFVHSTMFVALLVALSLAVPPVRAASPCSLSTLPAAARLFGEDFSPYKDNQNPTLGFHVDASQIQERLQLLQPRPLWIRAYGSTNGLENIPSAARLLGFCVAATAWISPNLATNDLEIANLISAIKNGFVDYALVGSEAILRGDVTVNQLIGYINQVRAAVPGFPVATADVWGSFVNNPQLIANSDNPFINLFPYWEKTSIGNAMCSLIPEYNQISALSGSKTVVISESGWPSAGNAQGAALPSQANENSFALQLMTWAAAKGIPLFYFDSLDEAWKGTTNEGPQGAHWGIRDAAGNLKPGMDAFFNGQTSVPPVPTCDGTIGGPLGLTFTYVPPYGNGAADLVEMQATGVKTANYVLAPYIRVGSWWTKPTQASPTVQLSPDGSARFVMVTGGSDAFATDIAVFMIPAGTVPPLVLGGALPSIPSAVAFVQTTRTPGSISGVVLDNQNNPIAGSMVSDAILGSTTTPADGKYSFANIPASGTVTPAASYPNYSFPAPSSFAIPSGNKVVNFQGTPTVDLSVESVVSSNTPVAGATIDETIVVSNSGPPASTDTLVSASSPPSFTVISAVSTRGSCNATAIPVICDAGPLPRSASATITVRLQPTVAGSFTLTASVSGPDLDTDTSNNTAAQAINVTAPVSISGVTSPTPSGNFGVGAQIGVSATFSGPVFVTGTPTIALNSGGVATYASGSGTNVLAFLYTVASGQNSAHLDYTSVSALSLNGGAIVDASSAQAVLVLPNPGAAGSLGASSNMVIDSVAPQVVSVQVLFGSQLFTVTGSPRNRLPWKITGIRVTFSKPIAVGSSASLTGVSATAMSGLASTVLNWSINPLVQGSFSAVLAGGGPTALRDGAGNALGGGAGFAQTFRVLNGDFNDDGVVNSADQTSVNLARNSSYNIFADIDGSNVVDLTDVQLVRSRIGTTLP